MDFHIDATSDGARACTLQTAHSTIKTPVFMPVGTVGAIKGLDAHDMSVLLQAQIILANTYHMYLRPTSDVVRECGGLHGFTGFANSFLTDSGGFQAFSLSHNTKHHEDGITFKSHIDGSMHHFTPQKVLDIQYDLRSDIMMILDDLVALPATKERVKASIDRTTRWAETSIQYHLEKKSQDENIAKQNIFAIIQGGVDHEFRKLSASQLCSLGGFDGFAIGGLSVGEPNEQMYDTVEFTTPLMPQDKPRYLMGVGTPEDLIENIARGVDMFDCVMPSRNARNGTLFTSFGKYNIKRAEFKTDHLPIDPNCNCFTCQNYSRAYLSHLFKAKELTFFRLATIHNLFYYLQLMKEARNAIILNSFSHFRKEFYSKREY